MEDMEVRERAVLDTDGTHPLDLALSACTSPNRAK